MEAVLGKALALEKKYDWLGARDQYEQALGAADEKDFMKRAELQEKIGYCLHRAAFQAERQEEFNDRMGAAVEAYGKARDLYASLPDHRGAAWMLRCEAVSKLFSHWITPDASGKLRLLDECMELEEKALTAFWNLGNKLEYGRTYNQLWDIFWHRHCRGEDIQVRRTTLAEGIEWGEKAIQALSDIGEQHEKAKAYLALAGCFYMQINTTIEMPEGQEKNRLKAITYLREALDTSERIGDDILSGWLHRVLGYAEGQSERGWKSIEETVRCGERTRDNQLQGEGLSRLAFLTMWKAIATENPDEKRKLGEEAMRLYDRAVQHLSTTSFYGYRGGVINPPWGYVEYGFYEAFWETDPARRLAVLDKAVELGTGALKAAEESRVTSHSLFHFLSKVLIFRAYIEPDTDKKRDLLKRALHYREIHLSIHEPLWPFNYWDRGVDYGYVSMIRSILAEIEPDPGDRRKLLEEAVSAKDKELQLMYRVTPLYETQEQMPLLSQLASREMSLATYLTRLYELSKEPEHLRRAIEASRKAIITAGKVGWVSPIAECYWKMAQAQDALGEHSQAAESFQHASESYEKAAERIPQLKEFYQDHASYMKAWSEIEKAKQGHAEKEYGTAKEHYEKAADLHKSTQRWNHLSSNYLAWARLEEAEDESRKEETEKARELFQQTADLFVEAEKSINAVLGNIENRDEKENAGELIKASRTRREYCLGRVALEEARILDRQGDHDASSGKYGSASGSFQKIMNSMEDESDRRELKPIASLCRAWEKMTQAEAEASPEMYLEASRLFDEAKEQSLDEKSKVLALGHSCFCKALEAGTRFETTRDPAMYSVAKKHVEAATSHYVRAGFQNASEYAKATYRLFDAYAYTYQAQTEMDVGKKTQLYRMAERLLQASAGSYIKARHPEKGEQIQRLLESVREEQELAMSLTEALHAPIITSATASFSMPTATHEQAVGLERFENADIQASLMPRDQEVRIGDMIKLKIDLVNAGKGGAQLIKVAELLPETFELVEKPDMYPVEETGLNMKGKSLAPLRTEELNLVLKPLDKGTYQIKPRILYLDEAGKYKSHEPEPATVVVKELGISGWLKGPPRHK